MSEKIVSGAAPDTAASRIDALSSLRGLARGTAWNMLGRGLPILVAVAATPLLLHQLGVARWALFALASSVIGSFGILDFGVSAALTRALAERIGTPAEKDAAGLVTTALAVLLLTSVAGAVAGFMGAPWLVDRLLHVPASLRREAVLAFQLLAAGAPVIIANAALWGVLCAYQRFRAVNLITIPVSAMYYVGPVLALLIRDSFVAVILSLIAVRLAQTAICAVLAVRLIPDLLRRPRFRPALLRDLLRIGAWVAISNTLSPLLTMIDRFIVGAIVPLAAVSHYATPVDLVWRFTIIPVAVTTALFPAVAACHRRAPERLGAMLRTGSLAVIVSVLPMCVVIVAFSGPLLTLWLGAAFSAQSHAVLTIVGCGVFFSCISALAGAMLDGLGRPDLNAWFLVVQALTFPAAVAALTIAFGIEGAAAGWTIRSVLNCVGRFYCLGRVSAAVRPAVRLLVGLALAAGVALAACAVAGPLAVRLPLVIVAAVGMPLLATGKLLEPRERGLLVQRARAMLAPLCPAPRRAQLGR